jgi:hypothetical protein
LFAGSKKVLVDLKMNVHGSGGKFTGLKIWKKIFASFEMCYNIEKVCSLVQKYVIGAKK